MAAGNRVGEAVLWRRTQPEIEPDWVQLFNGKDLTGWKTHPLGPGDWRVKEGAIVGRGNTSFLFSDKGDYANFHLRAEARINAAGDSGIFFRTPFNVQVKDTPTKFSLAAGYEAQIAVRSNYPVHTGSLMDPTAPILQQGPLMPHRPDEWFVLEVIANGNHLQTLVNGKKTADYYDEKTQFARGHLALQTWGLGITYVHFRKIEIKELRAQVIAGWGEVVDPVGDCKIAADKGRLTITVPATLHDLRADKNFAAPRLLQEIEGDFIAQVKVSGFPVPAAHTSTAVASYAGAGLVVWNKNRCLARLMRAGEGEAADPRAYVHSEVLQLKNPGAHLGFLTEAPAYLQIERRGNTLLLRHSTDGRTWSDPQTADNLDLASKLQVGVAAINAVKKEYTFTFDEFKLERPESGWVQLFNGKDLAGWKLMGLAGWKVHDGVLVGESNGPQGWLMSDKDYADLELSLEYKMAAGGNSGVYLRAWPQGAMNGGQFMEIQLIDDAKPADPKDRTGAIFSVVAPNPAPTHLWTNGIASTFASGGGRSRSRSTTRKSSPPTSTITRTASTASPG